ncbi:M23 family metallopeptidase [Cupriavidus sp. CuC1]|uniref:M23 family metallopeptidase n=1 Tax=Cupriavidus sp. CuC1 TaxID=3373131 RepID=UPI0037CFA0EE
MTTLPAVCGFPRSAPSFDIREDVPERRTAEVEIASPIQCEARISSAFRIRVDPVSGGIRVHTGVDLAARHATPVVAAGAGTIAFLGVDKRGYGGMSSCNMPPAIRVGMLTCLPL